MSKFLYFDEIGSTNDYLKENYDSLENYTVCATNYQTCGHGRMNRAWLTKKGENIALSLLVKDFQGCNDLAPLTVVSAIALHKLLLQYIPNILIKWPNDLLVNNKKISGILNEAISYNGEIVAVISGIGVNINQTEFADEIKNLTTSLKLETGKTFDVLSLSKEYAKILIESYDDYLSGKFNYIDYFRKYLYAKGQAISFYKGEVVHYGTLVDVDLDGRLIINEDGKSYKVESGEIKIIR